MQKKIECEYVMKMSYCWIASSNEFESFRPIYFEIVGEKSVLAFRTSEEAICAASIPLDNIWVEEDSHGYFTAVETAPDSFEEIKKEVWLYKLHSWRFSKREINGFPALVSPEEIPIVEKKKVSVMKELILSGVEFIRYRD